MEKEAIQNEIKQLLKIQSKWANTLKHKSEANSLISEISIFKHMLSTDFPNSAKYFKRNSSAEINFTDGISELRRYSQSKLKVKDDVYFTDGIKNICYGISNLIIELKMEIEE
jgi:hypothetical protein